MIDICQIVESTFVIFYFWLVVGIYRVMRLELQLFNYPWALPIFCVGLAPYLVGFIYIEEEEIPPLLMNMLYWNYLFDIYAWCFYCCLFYHKEYCISSTMCCTF